MSLSWLQTMARYSAWQNHVLVAVADTLPQSARDLERGAFFGSVMRTFSHVLWGDQIWFSRIAGSPAPDAAFPGDRVWDGDWDGFRAARRDMDRFVLQWADEQGPEVLDGDLIWYSGLSGKEMSRPRMLVLAHVFNHATHHRGQIHKMLTEDGVKTADTDLIFMPKDGPWL